MSKGKVSKIGRHSGHDSVKIKRKRKASEEILVESSDEEAQTLPEVEEDRKLLGLVEARSDSDGAGDSDRELQIALRDGLLKTDRLNYIVPTKRPIINRTAEMREKVAEFAKKLPWIETVDVTTKSNLTKDMIENDFDREMQLSIIFMLNEDWIIEFIIRATFSLQNRVFSYIQAEKAVQIAVPRLLSMGVKVIRPSDYYAEMAKSDGHMQKVRKRLLKIQEGKERQEAIRRMREEKKYASKVQKDVLDKRQSEKKQLMEAVKKHKKGMKQQLEDMLSNVKRMGLDQDDEATTSSGKSTKKFGGVKTGRGYDAKKQWKSEKFGYGGKKKGSKRNDKESKGEEISGVLAQQYDDSDLEEGQSADCSNYRPILLPSHSMKIFERIFDRRIREIVRLSDNQCGFVPGFGTIYATNAARLLVEKHRRKQKPVYIAFLDVEKEKPVYIAFLDVEKAFDRVPREVIWYALRQHNVPEELIEWVRMLYSCPKSRVQAAAGTSMEFPISVGKPVPWTLPYADDVMLACEDKDDLERQVQAWCDRLAMFGLKLNVKKTEYLTTNVNEFGSIKINGEMAWQISEEHIRHCMLFEFWKCTNATVATKNICEVYPDALDVRKCQR
ncbi:unnamed protein product [Heligmosomoides polygyrus]|uniref:Reverse transcriptase domain-containing protein n=1 Tax=Heligmosomoides polygyrus TaxID=6339 RepID=A0A183FP97_HELPZ|nr:unnamed protein product [Heligmosomoides polygyrus]